MQSRDFVFWLQGFFEVSEAKQLTEQQVEVIKAHLGLVFAHDAEIRPVSFESVSPFFTRIQSVASGKCGGEIFIC